MISANNLIEPNWAAPRPIKALSTTRLGGVSNAPFDLLNLGLNAGDDPASVIKNRSILNDLLPTEPVWLKQVHGSTVSTPDSRKLGTCGPFEADASISNIPNEVLAILTADCMPVLFSSNAGDVVGAAHAGWRGMSGGILENTVREMCALSPNLTPQEISAWMGPAISSNAFEVGEDVLQAFVAQGSDILKQAFTPISGRPGKYLADLYLLARDRLNTLGIKQIGGGDFCTFTDKKNFFSYRRDGLTGRFASLIWISPDK